MRWSEFLAQNPPPQFLVNKSRLLQKVMDRLIQWKEEKGRKFLLLKGVRQVGKTFLLKE